MPILPDVEGILFELLFFLPHSVNGNNLDEPEQPTTLSVRAGQGNSHTYNNITHKSQPPRSNDQHRTSAIGDPFGDDDSSPEQRVNRSSVDLLEPDRNGRDPALPITVHVAAVALLLSQVDQTWRTMESPLFDSAGAVVGRVKAAARITRRQTIPNGLDEATGLDGSEQHFPEPKLKTAKREKRASTKGHTCDEKYERHMKSRSCCGGGSRCSRSVEVSQLPDLPDLRHLPAIEEHIQSLVERIGERVPQSATIIYRGLRMPFRWYRTGSAEAIDKSLRETLGGCHGCGDVLCYRDTV